MIPDLQFEQENRFPTTTSSADFITNLEERIRKVHHEAHTQQLDKLVQYGKLKTQPTPHIEGEEVYLKNNVRRHKFDGRFKGPYRVSHQIDDQTIILDTDGSPYKTHRNRVKLRPRRNTKEIRSNDFVWGKEYEALFHRGGRSVGRIIGKTPY
jgi:hypothetical protein